METVTNPKLMQNTKQNTLVVLVLPPQSYKIESVDAPKAKVDGNKDPSIS